jgi:hypothetical protein
VGGCIVGLSLGIVTARKIRHVFRKPRADKIRPLADSSDMEERVISGLRKRSRAIRERWERLLRADGVTNPVTAPDALVAMIPSTMEHIFAQLANRAPGNAMPLSAARALSWPRFKCGYNPYINYFKFGERAMLETLVLVQCELSCDAQRDAELAAFFSVLRGLAAEETRGYCSDCDYRGNTDGCRFATSTEQPIPAT